MGRESLKEGNEEASRWEVMQLRASRSRCKQLLFCSGVVKFQSMSIFLLVL